MSPRPITILPESADPQTLTIDQVGVNMETAAQLLGVSVITVRKYTRKGFLPHAVIGRRVVYSVEALKEFVKSGKNSNNFVKPKQK
jgi:excisionase family DNA binding protein